MTPNSAVGSKRDSILWPALAFLGLSSLWLLIAIRSSLTDWDFTQFYIAAHLPVSSLYSRSAFIAFGQQFLAPIGVKYYPPFVRPAVFSLALKPLALFSYWHAYWIWAAAGLASYLAALLILFRRLKLPTHLLPWFALFFPSMFGLITGQDANVYLLVLVCALLLIVSGKEIAGGFLLALCVYKFNLIIFLPLVLLFKASWKSLLSFSAGALAAALASAALVPPPKYLALLHSIPRETIGFIPGGIRGLAIRAGHPGWYFPVAAIGAAACIYLIWKLPLLEAFCVALTGSLLLAYHVTWYDCALLVFPVAVACARLAARTRAVALTLLFIPFDWIYGREAFQVFVEVLILSYFAAKAFRPPVPANLQPSPVAN